MNRESHSLPPFALQPQLVPRIWGTRHLERWYPDATLTEAVGEAWLSGDACVALSGPLRGQSLREIFQSHGPAMLGTLPGTGDSPLLIKVIFAEEKLSVQVHPDDAMAQRKGTPRGKTECWYALEARPGAEVACGLKPGATREAIEASLKDNSLEEWLDVLPVAAGEMIFVEAGTVHAIWPGAVLLETQQNSDVTYRLYDYGRPRPLHLAESLEAMRFTNNSGKRRPVALADRELLVDCAYFRIERMTIRGATAGGQLDHGEPRLNYLFRTSGSSSGSSGGTVRVIGRDGDEIPWPANTVLAVPARRQEFTLHCETQAELVRIVAGKTAGSRA